MNLDPRADETLDVVLRGNVRLLQSRKGYRTSVDAMLVAWFAHRQAPEADTAVDLGAGSGLVGLTLALARAGRRLTFVERQPQLAERAQRNLALNDLSHRGEVVVHDLADGDIPLAHPVELIASNPPYFPRFGRILPAHAERRDAHYESTAGVEVFARRAAARLRPGGVLCVVFPADASSRLVAAFAAAGLGRMQLQHLHHRSAQVPPTRVLLAGRAGPLDVVTLPPATLHCPELPDHTYHPDIEAFLSTLGAVSSAPTGTADRGGEGH